MPNPDISVIIPTYNRLEALKMALDSLKKQSLDPKLFEILVVDDGSSDGTGDWLRLNAGGEADPRIRAFFNIHGGPAKARNTGLDNTQGDIVFITGDDIIAGENLLEEHLKIHNQSGDRNRAVLGLIKWHRDLKITPFMRWLEESGAMFPFNRIESPENLPYAFFYTSNVSVSRELIGGERFNEDFPYAAYEDLEFAYRLMKRGMKFSYNPGAAAYHYHPMDVEAFERRCYLTGRAAYIYNGMYKGEPDFIPAGVREDPGLYDTIKGRFPAVKGLAGMIQGITVSGFIYQKLMDYAIYLGYQDQIREMEQKK